MFSPSLSNLIFIALVSVSFVLAAPSRYKTVEDMPSDHVQALPLNSQPMNSFAEKHSEVRREESLNRRSSSDPRVILMPNRNVNFYLAESLLEAANVLRSDTQAIYSSISFLKRNGLLSTPDRLGNEVVFQLKEWQKHADMLRFLGDVKDRTDFTEQGEDLADEIHFTLRSAAQALTLTLSGVNSILNEMPSIQYFLGPMVYNIRTIITDVQHRSDPSTNYPSSDINLDEDISMCSQFENLNQFC